MTIPEDPVFDEPFESVAKAEREIEDAFRAALRGEMSKYSIPDSPFLRQAYDTARAFGLPERACVMYACVILHKRLNDILEERVEKNLNRVFRR